MENMTKAKYSSEAWQRMVSQMQAICEEYKLALSAEDLLMHGLDELFDKKGHMFKGDMQLAIEKGKRWAFGNRQNEAIWAAHAGD